jgi:hypothetical protein
MRCRFLGRDDSTKKNRLTLKKRARSLPLFLACNVMVVLSTSVGAATISGGINGVFGMTGVVAGEVMRLTVASGPAQVSEMVTPCQFELSFVDAHGRPLVNEEGGQPYRERVTIAVPSVSAIASQCGHWCDRSRRNCLRGAHRCSVRKSSMASAGS